MTGAESAGELPQLWAGAWDPHDPNRFITAGGNHIQVRAGQHAQALQSMYALWWVLGLVACTKACAATEACVAMHITVDSLAHRCRASVHSALGIGNSTGHVRSRAPRYRLPSVGALLTTG